MTSMEVDKNTKTSKNSDDDLLKDARDPQVIEKYKCAGVIANNVLFTIIKNCKPGVKIVDLCKSADNMIITECNKVYTNLKNKGRKGISFPTCISPNDIAGHLSPLSSDERTLKYGDLVKIDLGVHIDGFCAVVAHTIVLGPYEGVVANVIASAWTGAQAALRLLTTKHKNSDITEATTKSGESFDCEAMESVLSHEMRQYVMDSENTIILRETPERKVNVFEFEDYQVFGIDIMMCSGRGKATDRGVRCTLYKRNVEVESYPLKMRISKDLLKHINKNYPTFPFSLRYIENEKFRYGVTECKTHSLIQPYPVLSVHHNDYVAHFKFTCIITPQGTLQITGLPLDMSIVNPTKQIQDKKLLGLLESPFSGTLPTFYKKPIFPEYTNDVVQNNTKSKNKSDVKMKNKQKNKSNNNNRNRNSNRNKNNKKKNNNRNKNNRNNNNNRKKNQNNKQNNNRSNNKKQAMDVDD